MFKKSGFYPTRLTLLFILSFFCTILLTANGYSESSTYTISPGDCLWNIASKTYSDPYLWKKIWQANPYIKDPNFIYPGNSIVLPDAATLETMQETVNEPSTTQKENVPSDDQQQQQQKQEQKGDTAKQKTEESATSTTKTAKPADTATEGEIIAQGQVAPEVTEEPQKSDSNEKGSISIKERDADDKKDTSADTKYTTDSFIIQNKFEIDGKIVGSQDDKFLISQGDIVYLSFGKNKGAVPGKKCIAYRLSKSVSNEDASKDIGQAYLKTGILELTSDVEDDVSTARVTMIYMPLEIGDLVRLMR